jgi:hypothetical protein
MPTTAEAILEEDGAESALVQVAQKVKQAERVIMALLDEDSTRAWSIRDLQNAVADRKPLSPTVISIAFLRLRDAGIVHVDTDLRAHAA